MGVLADLIVAELADAQAILASDYPLEKFKGSNADGLDPLMLAELHALLTEHQIHGLLPAYRPNAQASDQGPWLIHVPSEMVQSLANLPPQDHPPVAVQWAAGERMREHAPGAHWAEQVLETAAFRHRWPPSRGRSCSSSSTTEAGVTLPVDRVTRGSLTRKGSHPDAWRPPRSPHVAG